MTIGRYDPQPRWYGWGLLWAHPFKFSIITLPLIFVCRKSPFALWCGPLTVQNVVRFPWEEAAVVCSCKVYVVLYSLVTWMAIL